MEAPLYLLVGGLEHFLFFHILGISSSQPTNSYFSEGFKPPTSKNINNFYQFLIYPPQIHNLQCNWGCCPERSVHRFTSQPSEQWLNPPLGSLGWWQPGSYTRFLWECEPNRLMRGIPGSDDCWHADCFCGSHGIFEASAWTRFACNGVLTPWLYARLLLGCSIQ